MVNACAAAPGPTLFIRSALLIFSIPKLNAGPGRVRSPGFLFTPYLPADSQPFNRLFAHLALYAAAYHTYFTGCETKLAVRAGLSKRIVNALIPLTCK
jgi:hypothetical protein